MGTTFQGYQRLLRINSAYRSLVDGSTETNPAFNSGYEALRGMAPSFRSVMQTSPSDAGQTSVITIERISTPLGPMLAGATDDGLCLLEFTDRRMLEKQIATITRLLKARVVAGSHNHIQTTYVQLQEYFAGTRKSFDIPLVLPGADFQNLVWESLRTVPYGEAWSYARQAAFLGRSAAVRPVAAAHGYHRISIIVPCHRIIGSDGSLTGYGGGLARKCRLLELEHHYQPDFPYEL
ncbi:MAG: methylated-DNA--[protein]-cysteine S-methyltransferase [Alkalispirochaeta sp.]